MLIDPVSGIAFLVVAFWAFVIEAGLVALLLMCSGLATARIFVAYFAANLIIFVLFFHPLLQRQSVPIALLEAAVVVLDAVAIKFLSNFDALQGDDYSHLTWRRAGVIAAVGNAASFFVGQIAAAAPWYMHSAPE